MVTTAKFITKGMHCGSCSMLVTMNLTDIAGVTSVECEYATGKTVVEFDESIIGVEAIRRAIEESGYEAETAPERGDQ